MRRLIFPLVLGLGGVAVLVATGLWQLQRMEWKRGVLDAIEARISDAPVALPGTPDPEADLYRAVAVEGRYQPGEILILSGMKGVGPGYRVVAPFETSEGRRVLIDRGFVPEAARDTARPQGATRITGNLHWPDDADGFTPEPDVATGLWFARDVAAMADAFGTEPVLIVLRETSQTGTGVTPQPVDSAGIPNDHFGYALTWFALALVWLGMTALMIRRSKRPAL